MPAKRIRPLMLCWGLCIAGCGNGSDERGRDAGLPPEGVPLGDPWSARSGDPGPLPDRVHLRTNTESYNRRYYFGTRAGSIWFKPNIDQSGTDGGWDQMPLPAEIEGRVFEISADDNEMIALTVDRKIWTMTGALFEPTAFSWKVNWGMPFWNGPGHALPDWALRWEWSVISPQEDVYWLDPAGNRQPVGGAKVSHIWILPPDQQRLTYNDPWLPLDFSYGMCGPLRDRFRAENLSASGSTIFVVNRYGDMFTRLFDFDISGADGVFFRYSYEDQTGIGDGAPIQLPSAEWVQHPKIDGKITNLIGIHKLGEGAIHRMMRVEGIGPGGVNGYFEKDVIELDRAAWVFHETGAPIRGVILDNRPSDSSSENLGPSSDLRYSRNMDRLDAITSVEQISTAQDWAAEITSFNVYCSPTTLKVHVSNRSSFELILYTADAIRGTPRAAGLDGSARDFSTTIELPRELAESLSSQPPEVREFVALYFGAQRFLAVGLHATIDELVICPSGPTLDRSCAVESWRFAADR